MAEVFDIKNADLGQNITVILLGTGMRVGDETGRKSVYGRCTFWHMAFACFTTWNNKPVWWD